MRKVIPIIIFLLFNVTCIIDANSAEPQIIPGNIIHITVLGYPELSKAVLVQQDGSTDYPLLSNIPIDGMTEHELSELLHPILARLVERPRIFISIAEHLQLEVLVEGQVTKPGSYTIKGPINLQGVLSVAGGVTKEADLRKITVIRRENDAYKEIPVDLYKFFADREKGDIPEMMDGDIVFVPIISTASTVRVMGAVRSPGPYITVKDENIADVINMAGGPLSSGNMNRITYITISEGRRITEKIRLKELINKGMTDQIPLAHPGDIIVVEEYNQWQKMSWWIQIIRDAALLMSSIVILTNL